MANQSSLNQSSLNNRTTWPRYDPHRDDFVAIIGHRLLLAAGILIAILIIWGSATSPRSTVFGTDITTAIPDYVVDDSTPSNASTATYTPGNRQ